MYKVSINEKIGELKVEFEDQKQQRLSFFFQMYDQSIICELYEALKQIKEGKLEKYGFQLEPFSFIVDKEKARVIYNDGFDKTDDTYTYEEFNNMFNIYCDEFQKAFSVNLREVNEEYEPVIEGIIDESQYIDSREKRNFN